jgi:hypothetical protein
MTLHDDRSQAKFYCWDVLLWCILIGYYEQTLTRIRSAKTCYQLFQINSLSHSSSRLWSPVESCKKKVLIIFGLIPEFKMNRPRLISVLVISLVMFFRSGTITSKPVLTHNNEYDDQVMITILKRNIQYYFNLWSYFELFSILILRHYLEWRFWYWRTP